MENEAEQKYAENRHYPSCLTREKHDHRTLRFGLNNRRGRSNDAEGGGRSSGHFTVLHIKTGEKDHEAAEKGDGVDLKIPAAYDTLTL